MEEWEKDFQDLKEKHSELMRKQMLRREIAKELKEAVHSLDTELDTLVVKAQTLRAILGEIQQLEDFKKAKLHDEFLEKHPELRGI